MRAIRHPHHNLLETRNVTRGNLLIKSAVAAILATAPVALTHAAPSVSVIYTEYTANGTPSAINITGSGFQCAGCIAPRVTLAGKALAVTAVTPNVISAQLPGILADGAYTLMITDGLGATTTYALPVSAKDMAAPASATVVTAGPGRRGRRSIRRACHRQRRG